MTYILKILLCFFPIIAISQNTLTVGEQYSIRSSLLNEERKYWISLPENYNRTDYARAHYPVVYLLDGERTFLTHVAIQKSFTNGLYRYMPDAIVVGVENTDRGRDLTTSKSTLIRDGKAFYQNSGGAETFLNFLTHELRPHIDSIYRTDGYNMLVGHSFGGLFAMYTLVHHTQNFNAYVVLDPSLWWDNRKLYDEAVLHWPKINGKGINVYIAMAGDDFKSEDKLRHAQTIEEFCTTVLPLNPENGLRSHWKYYPDEDHGTITIPGTIDAIRFIFEGITLPVKQVPNDVSLISQTYQKVSSQIGHQLLPAETLVEGIGRYALSIDNTKGALDLFRLNLKNYPQSANAHIAVGDALKHLGRREEAMKMYNSAVTLAPSVQELIAKKLGDIK